jgi:hypothetical protein
VLEACEQDGLTMDQTYWLLEVHARTVIGAQIALYLDRMIDPDQREEMKLSLLSAAVAISMLRKAPCPRKVMKSSSATLAKYFSSR